MKPDVKNIFSSLAIFNGKKVVEVIQLLAKLIIINSKFCRWRKEIQFELLKGNLSDVKNNVTIIYYTGTYENYFYNNVNQILASDCEFDDEEHEFVDK